MKIKHLVLGLFLIALPASASAAVLDYTSEEDLKYSMDYLWHAGIIHGYPDGTYGLERDINRAEFTKMVIISLGETALETHCFNDVKDEWFSTYVCKAAELGIIEGYPDGNFRPSQKINFVEAAKIVANAAKLDTSCPECNTDQWFEKYVRALEKKNAIPEIVESFEQQMKRGVVFEMMWRVLDDRDYRPHTTYDLISAGNAAGNYLIRADQVLAEGRIYPQVGMTKANNRVVLHTHQGEVQVPNADMESFEFLNEAWNNVLIFRDSKRLYVLNNGQIEFEDDISPEDWKRENLYDQYYQLQRPLNSGGGYEEYEVLSYDLENQQLSVYQSGRYVEEQSGLERVFSSVIDTPKLRQQQENAGAPELGGEVSFLFDADSRYLVDVNGLYSLDGGRYVRLARFVGVAREIPFYADAVKIIADAENVYVFHASEFDYTTYQYSYKFSQIVGADPESFQPIRHFSNSYLIAVDDNGMYMIYEDVVDEIPGANEENTDIWLGNYNIVLSHDGVVRSFYQGKVSELVDADFETLSQVGSLLKDKNSIWLFDKDTGEMVPVNVRGAEFVSETMYKLDRQVYYIDIAEGKVKSVEGADADSFRKMAAGTDYLFRDRNKAFFLAQEINIESEDMFDYVTTMRELEGFNPDEFQSYETNVSDRIIFSDDDQVFMLYEWWQGMENYLQELEGIDARNFKVYYNPETQTEKMEKGWGKMDMIFFTDGKKVWVSDRDQIDEEVLKVIEGADPDTFNVMEYFEQNAEDPALEY